MNGDVHGTVVQARAVHLQSRAPTALDGLPPVAAEFTGRIADLAAVAAAPDSPQPVVVSTGLAGVGKTALAVTDGSRDCAQNRTGQPFGPLWTSKAR